MNRNRRPFQGRPYQHPHNPRPYTTCSEHSTIISTPHFPCPAPRGTWTATKAGTRRKKQENPKIPATKSCAHGRRRASAIGSKADACLYAASWPAWLMSTALLLVTSPRKLTADLCHAVKIRYHVALVGSSLQENAESIRFVLVATEACSPPMFIFKWVG